MTYDTIGDAVTMQGGAEASPKNEKGTKMDKSIGDDPTMKPKDGRNKRGAFAPGDVIAGRYVVESIIGEGGMGIVYQCLDRVGGVKVAVKCLPPEVSRNADEMEDIRDNYRLVADLHHPNIAGARTLEKDEATGDYYLVMDLAPGMSLKRWMKRNPQATTKVKLAILRQVAAALDYAHSRKVIHRDVKPENVMVDDEGGVKVLDFGLAAQIRSSQSRTSAAVTSRGGTPGYKSPEQWLGKPQREPADVYSFGVMAYWMFAGELPFDGDDPVVLGHAVLTAPVEPISGLPAHMNAALAKALEKEPDKRFASCGAVVDALEGGTSPVSGEESGGSRGSMMGKIAAGVALLTVAAVGGWWWTTAREETKVPAIVQPPPVSPVPPVGDPASDVTPVPSDDPGRVPSSPSKIEGEAAQQRGSMTPANAVAIAESDVVDIRVEADVQKGKLARIDDADGFKARKETLVDEWTKADGYYKARQWVKSALAYTNFVESCKNFAKLNDQRIEAGAQRKNADAARSSAKEAEAEQYASERWNAAEGLMGNARDKWADGDFVGASGDYVKATQQFNLAVTEAPAERTRQEEGKKEGERKAAAERERRKNWPAEGSEFTINRHSLYMTMKWCPKGTFTMGSPESEEGRYNDERQYQVTLTKGFWMGETEVTQGQWKRLMDDETIVDLARKGLQDDTEYMLAGKKQTLRMFFNKSKYDDPQGICGDVSDDVPVYFVSWDDAVRFCRKLTAKERAEGRIPDGYEYRLPTEAEWEYACRAKTDTALPNGKDIRILGANNAPALDDIAWYGGNSSEGFNGRGLDTSNWKEKQYPGGRAYVREVKCKRPNNWGLYDMIGNVWEWCEDWYGDYPYGSATDPTGTESGAFRVLRGGSWNGGARNCRSACRDGNEPGCCLISLGFRVALAPKLSKSWQQQESVAENAQSEKGNCVSEDTGSFTEYVVQRGDYMAKIAKKFNVTVSVIKQLNGLKKDGLRIGQKLKIPKHIGYADIPKHGDTKTLTLPGGATMEMIYVVPGEFMMGSPTSEDGRYDDETQHRVTLTKGFWLGKYEVTQEQWQSVMGENPSYFKGARNPVENVSWEDCQKFIEKVNARLNCGARLPTEAEWEYACRAGSTGAYGGNGNLDDMGWYSSNSGGKTHPVGQKGANRWGFYDMHGDVWEWCEDKYDASGGNRVLRGGSWRNAARVCRSADRYGYGPGYRDYRYGFRLCCSAEPRE